MSNRHQIARNFFVLQLLLINCELIYGGGYYSPYSPDYSNYGGNIYDVTLNTLQPSSVGNGYSPPPAGFGGEGFDANQQIQTTTPDPATLGCGVGPSTCPPSRYRTLDGSCNNLANPGLGIPQTRYNRLLPAKYGDGISTPTTATDGSNLPPARLLSLLLYPDVPINDPKFTLAAMQYGQIITHDMSMIAGSTQAQPHNTKCCSGDGQLLPLSSWPEHCFPLVITSDDPINQNRLQPMNCMNFVRTITDRDRNCVGGVQPAEQLTAVNPYLDLSVVYGNTDQVSAQIREFVGGRLRADFRNGQEWLPRNSNATGVCSIANNPQEVCYMAGDTRVNQNPQLTILHITLFREHNRIVNALSAINPHWNDETLYQEARKINMAQHQYITYYEWLPIFLGIDNSLKNRIIYDTKEYVNDYDANVDPRVINEHATAAFRFFHSLIVGYLDLVGEFRNNMGNIRLSDWFNRPVIVEQNNNFDSLARGMATQPELKSNEFHDSEITQFLFRMGQVFGTDLKAIDIQRNRDHGLASYNDMRVFCGLPRANRFEDFLDVISADNVRKLSGAYQSVDDVDLTVGGSLELLVPGSLAGPTFLCILTEQFYRTRAGDRFWFENSNQFTLAQLNEIRKTSISRLFCDNGRNIRSMQRKGFERISPQNSLVPCEQLPAVDLSLWRDNAGGQSGFAQLSSGYDYDDEYPYKK